MIRETKVFSVYAIALLLLVLVSCSTSNTGTSPAPERNVSDMFSVAVHEGQGTYTPSMIVEDNGTEVVVSINAAGAEELSGAFFDLNYDRGYFTPDRVEIGSFLGNENETLSLSLTDIADRVPVGITQIAKSTAPVNGNGELARVYFRNEPFEAPRTVSGAPMGEANAVDDLSLIDQSGSSVTLRWTEKNVGDYNNDSLVSAADLTPLGQFFGQEVTASSDPLRVGMADGNHDGWITVNDLTPIGVNFDNIIHGYAVFTDASGETQIDKGTSAVTELDVARTDFNSDMLHPIIYTITFDVTPGPAYNFTVRPVDKNDMSNPGPVSNTAELKDDPGAPKEPTNLTATSGPGHQQISLDWDASLNQNDQPAIDIDVYVVYRKETAADDSTWVEVVQVPGTSTEYVDSDDTFQEISYDYHVYAKDLGGEMSGFSAIASATPYFIEGPDAPIQVVADNTIGIADAIEIRWSAPADDTGIMRYKVFCKEPGSTVFGLLATTMNKYVVSHLHTNLTPGETYTYYVKSVGQEADSDPSAQVSNTPCEYVPEIHITDLTADKLTHLNNGSEAAANITVTCDETPDSVDWSSSATSSPVTGTGTNVTWKPSTTAAVEKVTITCTVHLATSSDTRTIDFYVTDQPIITSIGNSGKYKTGAPTTEMLEKLIDGGDKIMNRQFEYYMSPENVVVLSTFDTDCYYCKKEFPYYDSWANDWSEVKIVLDCCDGYDKTKALFQASVEGVSPVDMFDAWCEQKPSNYVASTWFKSWGLNGSFPEFIILDRDGYVREHHRGFLAAAMEEAKDNLKKLIGVS